MFLTAIKNLGKNRPDSSPAESRKDSLDPSRTELMIKTSTMRLADRWLGVPLCLTLTAARRVIDYFDHTAPREPFATYPVCEAGRAGLEACLPVQQSVELVELVGRENVYFLVFEENRFIPRCHGANTT